MIPFGLTVRIFSSDYYQSGAWDFAINIKSILHQVNFLIIKLIVSLNFFINSFPINLRNHTRIITIKSSELLDKFSGPVFSFLSFAFFTDSCNFCFNDLILWIFLHFVYNEHIFQNYFKFFIILNDQKEVDQLVLNNRNMFLLEKSWSLEHTNLNEFGNKVTILKIFIISDHLNKSFSQELSIFVWFSFSNNWWVVTKFRIRSHFN